MSTVRRLILVRHGETLGESSTRYHGSSDVELSPEGIEQMHEARRALQIELDGYVIASSPLKRAWKGAWILGDGAPVQLVDGFREIHFGRWEGMSREEIQAADPVSYEDWQNGVEGFEYPGGESRAAFRERVLRALGRLLGAQAHTAVVVAHKGVIRTVVEALTGQKLERDEPTLGGVVQLVAQPDGAWRLGVRSSDPPALAAAEAAA
ncbi:MAG TPA: histidine phosphatase family protein [Myxococcota bacterium]|jgi:broad specificity phosphatase PhoE|nr:histidine phosphatase family protein [Myxococcota bacterium]